ncbi:MAG: flagellar hook-basal body complex protein [Desulfovibrio sp.]|uniref:flagellar hook protein FlgE n=1 Tax=Desulfovibrio sp. TaxID=885 RepID=UPI0025B92065|nr:flagellar hook-basal body complex protein [Desulfovibrio sp.]MCI7567975.1 flagellar hook-basal body complex protein [Desulfovibrio sp.]
MNSSLFIGATGLKGLSQGMSVISNNLANVSTYGFKQQNIQYSDLIYSSQGNLGSGWASQEDSLVTTGETGHGMAVDSVRTFFFQGAFEGTNSVSDLALDGKGFFQVTDEQGNEFYTRTGDFITDEEGYMETPSGMKLSGYQYNEDGSLGGLGAVQIDRFGTMDARATTSLSLELNLGLTEDLARNADNPYFGLLSQYDARANPPLTNDVYGFSQAATIYDAEGNAQEVTIYFDGAPSSGNGGKQIEFLVALTQDAAQATQAGDGLLMSGVLSFASNGEMTSIAAFTPSEAGTKDLTQWTAAETAGGGFVCNVDGRAMTIDFGFDGGTAAMGVATAAEVGSDATLLGGLTDLVASGSATTGYSGETSSEMVSQDGYSEGRMSYYDITESGDLVAYYDNGQSQNLWQIPVCRFTSEDGLYREGDNLYRATEASGNMEMGVAGTENYGTINAYNLEVSNVDTATEMVNLIITQRGFQSNSKVITTADEMLRKAMEIKRT